MEHDCDAAGLPNVYFNDAQGNHFVIPPSVYVFKYDVEKNLCITGFSGYSNSPRTISPVVFGEVSTSAPITTSVQFSTAVSVSSLLPSLSGTISSSNLETTTFVGMISTSTGLMTPVTSGGPISTPTSVPPITLKSDNQLTATKVLASIDMETSTTICYIWFYLFLHFSTCKRFHQYRSYSGTYYSQNTASESLPRFTTSTANSRKEIEFSFGTTQTEKTVYDDPTSQTTASKQTVEVTHEFISSERMINTLNEISITQTQVITVETIAYGYNNTPKDTSPTAPFNMYSTVVETRPILSSAAMVKLGVVSTLILSLAAKTTVQIERKERSTLEKSSFRHQQLHAQLNKVVHGVDLSTADLTNVGNSFYSCPLTVGNGQKFNLDLDTGSSDTWFKGSNCQDLSNDGSCKGPVIDLSDKTVTKAVGVKPVSNKYGSGNATLDIYYADVTIGSSTARSLPIGVASKVSHMPIEGLLGLAFDGISTLENAVHKNALFFDQLGLSGNQNKFGFYLSNAEDKDMGEVTFGGVDEDKFTGIPNYYDIISFQDKNQEIRAWWAFAIDQWTISVAGTQVQHQRLQTSKNEVAIADTGTTLMSLGLDVATTLNNALPGSADAGGGYWTLNCDPTNMPDVVFSDGLGNDYVIPPSVYIWKYDEQNNLCASGFKGEQFDPRYIGTLIFGDVFLRNYYSIYDKSTNPPRVGFAKAVHTKVQPTTTTTVPVVQTTTVPVVQTTTAPVVLTTTAPVVLTTTAPVVLTTTAPVVQTTTAPVVLTTTAPVVQTTTVPVVQTTTVPVVQTTTVPVVQTTTAPVVLTTTAPVVLTTTAPVVLTTTAPVVQTTTAPVVQTTTAPVVQTTTVPVVQTTTTPCAPSAVTSDVAQVQTTTTPAAGQTTTTAPVVQTTTAPVVQTTTAPVVQTTTVPV
ncbi:hypothetical protein HDV06_002095, partial [Boothiomyces sp. JEL0866]